MAVGDLLYTLDSPADGRAVTSVNVSGTEHIVVTDSGSTGHVHTYDDGQGAWTVDTTFSITGVPWASHKDPEGDWVSIGTDAPGVSMIDTSTWTEETILDGGGSFVEPAYNPPKFSPTGDRMVAGEEADVVYVYDTTVDSHPDNWTLEYEETLSNGFQTASWSHSGRYLTVPFQDGVHVYDTNDWSIVYDWAPSDLPNGADIRGSGWTTDDEIFAIGDDVGDFFLYEFSTGNLLYTLNDAGSGRARELFFFSDDTICIHGNRDGTNHVHEYDSGTDSWTNTVSMSEPTSSVQDWDITTDKALFLSGSESTGAYAYEGVEEATTTPVSGTFTIDGTGTSGATVRGINDTQGAQQGTDSTASDGSYSIEFPIGDEGHFMLEYEDPDTGEPITAESKPFINVQDTS